MGKELRFLGPTSDVVDFFLNSLVLSDYFQHSVWILCHEVLLAGFYCKI